MLESIIDTELTANIFYDDQEDVYSSNTTGYIDKHWPISHLNLDQFVQSYGMVKVSRSTMWPFPLVSAADRPIPQVHLTTQNSALYIPYRGLTFFVGNVHLCPIPSKCSKISWCISQSLSYNITKMQGLPWYCFCWSYINRLAAN